jgi:hypothetical protein
VFQIVDFCSVNDLKFTYAHLQFQNYLPGVIPRTPVIKGMGGKGRGRRGEEGRDGREGRGWDESSKTNSVYGPAKSYKGRSFSDQLESYIP